MEKGLTEHKYKIQVIKNKGIYSFLIQHNDKAQEIRNARDWHREYIYLNAETPSLRLEELCSENDVPLVDKLTTDCVLYTVAKILDK